MLFTEAMVEAMREGRKVETRRVANDNPRSPWFREKCSYKLGKPYAIVPGRSKPGIGFLELVEEPRLGPVDSITHLGARREGFANRASFLMYFGTLHGEFDLSMQVWALHFKILELS